MFLSASSNPSRDRRKTTYITLWQWGSDDVGGAGVCVIMFVLDTRFEPTSIHDRCCCAATTTAAFLVSIPSILPTEPSKVVHLFNREILFANLGHLLVMCMFSASSANIDITFSELTLLSWPPALVQGIRRL